MSLNAAMFSSKRPDWETPPDLFAKLHAEFNFTLDVCALPHNAKLPQFFTPETDGLSQPWMGARVWCNPPYGRGVEQWVKRCSQASKTPARVEPKWTPELAVMLLPVRSDTKWWHRYIIPHAAEVRFIEKRLRFVGAKSSAPFPSAIVVFR